MPSRPAYVPANTPPLIAQAPTATTRRGLRHRLVRAPGRVLQVPGHDPRDQQQVRMAGRGDEVDPQALDVVVRVEQRGDLPVAAVARPGVQVPDVERATQGPADRSRQARAAPSSSAEIGRGGMLLSRLGRSESRSMHQVGRDRRRRARSRPEPDGVAGQARAQAPQKTQRPRSSARSPSASGIAPVGHSADAGALAVAAARRRARAARARPAAGRAALRIAARDRPLSKRAEQSFADVERHRQRSVQA